MSELERARDEFNAAGASPTSKVAALRNEAAASASSRAGYYLPAGSRACERVLNAYCRTAHRLPLRGGDRGGGYARYVLFDGEPGQIGRFFDAPFVGLERNETSGLSEADVPGRPATGASASLVAED